MTRRYFVGDENSDETYGNNIPLEVLPSIDFCKYNPCIHGLYS